MKLYTTYCNIKYIQDFFSLRNQVDFNLNISPHMKFLIVWFSFEMTGFHPPKCLNVTAPLVWDL